MPLISHRKSYFKAEAIKINVSDVVKHLFDVSKSSVAAFKLMSNFTASVSEAVSIKLVKVNHIDAVAG